MCLFKIFHFDMNTEGVEAVSTVVISYVICSLSSVFIVALQNKVCDMTAVSKNKEMMQ